MGSEEGRRGDESGGNHENRSNYGGGAGDWAAYGGGVCRGWVRTWAGGFAAPRGGVKGRDGGRRRGDCTAWGHFGRKSCGRIRANGAGKVGPGGRAGEQRGDQFYSGCGKDQCGGFSARTGSEFGRALSPGEG